MKMKRLSLCAVVFLIANAAFAQVEFLQDEPVFAKTDTPKHEIGIDLLPAIVVWNFDMNPRFQAYYRGLGEKSNWRIGLYYREEPMSPRTFLDWHNDTTVTKTEERPSQQHLLLTAGKDRWWSVQKNRVDFFIGIDGVFGFKFIDFEYTEGLCSGDRYCYLVPTSSSPQFNATTYSASATYWSMGIRPYYGFRFKWGDSMGLLVEGGPIMTSDTRISTEGDIMREQQLEKLVYLDLFPIQNVSFYFRF